MKITHKYDDIIEMKYPLETTDTFRHPRMALTDRAKIFAPFAALHGYEGAIAAKQRIVVPRVELTEDAREQLDRRFQKLLQLLKKGQHPMVTVIYFQKNREILYDRGEYLKITGMAAGFDSTSNILQVVEKRIELADICELEGEGVDAEELL